MEERLNMFIQEYEKLSLEHIDISADAVPIVRFVNHQVLEVARDCLKKSEEKLITRGYFYEMSEKMELLLAEVYIVYIFIINIYTCKLNNFIHSHYRQKKNQKKLLHY